MQRRRGRMLAQGLGLVAAFGVLIALPQTAAEGVRSGLTLCGQVILPVAVSVFCLQQSVRSARIFGAGLGAGRRAGCAAAAAAAERGERVRDRDDGRLPRRGAGRGASV